MRLRTAVLGAAFDNETGLRITEPGACRADNHAREKRCDDPRSASKPAFRVIHHEMDAIVDVSCSEKIDALLRRRGYPGPEAFRLCGGTRSLANHLWQDADNRPVLDFFAGRLVSGRSPPEQK